MTEKLSDEAFYTAEKFHNRFRKKHGCPVLKRSERLSEQAEEFANGVASGDNPEVPIGLGINEYQSTGEGGVGQEVIVRSAVTEWYENNSDYNWETPTQSPQNALLFSQILWKSSTHFGIGLARNGDETVVISLYEPAGNEGTDVTFKQNVPKLLLK